MGIGDILKGVGGIASLIPGVGTIVGTGLSAVGGMVGAGEAEEEKKRQEQKAAEEAAIKAKQAGIATVTATPGGDTPITSPNMAILGQQLQQQQMQPGGMPMNMNGLLNNRRNNGY